MTTVDVVIPLRTVPGLNAREHWRTRAKRVKREREATRLAMQGIRVPVAFVLGGVAGLPPCRVLFVRVSPQLCDTDNLAGAMKHVRDEVAKLLGVDDSPRGGVQWDYDQVRGAKGQHEVRVTIEAGGGE